MCEIVQLLDGFNNELREVHLPVQYYLEMEDYVTGLDCLRWYLRFVVS